MFIFDSVLMNMMYVYECIAGKKCHFDELVPMIVIHLHNSAVLLPYA